MDYKRTLQHIPTSVHSRIICPFVCSIYFIKLSVLSCILLTPLQFLMYMFSVCAHKHTHTFVSICCIYLLNILNIYLTLHILLGEMQRNFLLQDSHVIQLLKYCCFLLCNWDSRASRNGEHPRVVQCLYSKYSEYHKYQRSKRLYPNIRLIPQTIQFPD